MVKVVYVIISLELGGAERMLERLVQESSKNPSIQQSIITLKKEGSIGRQLQQQGFEVVSMGMESLFSAPIILYKLMQIFRLSRPDVVYTWMYHADLIGGLAAFLARIKNIIWGIRNSKIPQGMFSFTSVIIKICAILSFYIPNKIVCCAEAAKLAHIELGFCATKMVVIPNGYDLSSFKPSFDLRRRVRKDLGLLESTLVVGVIGRFDPLKDFNNFVQASGLVLRDLDSVKFLMVGKGLDKDNAELNVWIKKTLHPDNFILIGEASSHDLLAAMDVYCLSSKAEGFPNVVAEAMAMRIPCVVTDVGDAARIVGESGVVVEPMDAYALYKGLMLMLTLEKHDRQALGDTARQSIENQYDIREVQKKFLNLVSTS
jgi:glycosyltransferase involved in cell wall biosynthesis